MTTRAICIGLVVFVALMLCTPSNAHDLKGLVTEQTSLSPEARQKLEEIRELRLLLAAEAAANPRNGQTEAVVQRALRWPSGMVDICFFDGGPAARNHIAQVAQKWAPDTNLKLDFGPDGNRRSCTPQHSSSVRVSFRGSGYWSFVGTQARLISTNKQTLNLEGMDKQEFSDGDDGIILHEFGHAIGFEHEHQSPKSGCDAEFNWPYLYTALGWDEATVDRNMKRLDSRKDGLLVTAFDSKSIMLYSLDPAAFKDPAHSECYIPKPNTKISNTDRAAAQTVYPAALDAAPAASAAGSNALALKVRRLSELLGK